MDDIKFSQLIINFKFENTFCIRSSVMKLNVSLIYATALIGVHPGQPYNQLFMGSTSYNLYVKCFLFSSRVTQTHLFALCASHDRPTTPPQTYPELCNTCRCEPAIFYSSIELQRGKCTKFTHSFTRIYRRLPVTHTHHSWVGSPREWCWLIATGSHHSFGDRCCNCINLVSCFEVVSLFRNCIAKFFFFVCCFKQF